VVPVRDDFHAAGDFLVADGCPAAGGSLAADDFRLAVGDCPAAGDYHRFRPYKGDFPALAGDYFRCRPCAARCQYPVGAVRFPKDAVSPVVKSDCRDAVLRVWALPSSNRVVASHWVAVPPNSNLPGAALRSFLQVAASRDAAGKNLRVCWR
jgi:hypothetical protein